MAQVPIQRFQLGDRAWFADGRSGLVTQADFNPNALQWQYFLSGLGGAFLDSDLFLVNPIVDVPVLTVAPVMPPFPPQVPLAGLTFDQVQDMIDISLAAAISGLIASIAAADDVTFDRVLAEFNPRFEALSNSIIRNVAQLSEIQSSGQVIESAADESGDGGSVGLFRRIGGFIAAPFTSLLDVVGAWFLGEVRDGLNR